MNYVYILECEDGSYYTGWTNDLNGRYQAHCNGKGAKYTRMHRPVRIAWYEEYDSRQEAMQREYRIKQMTHREKEILMGAVIVKKENLTHNKYKRRITMELKFYRCNTCKKIVVQLNKAGCPTMCCGKAMEEMRVGTTDGAAEKHVPAVTKEDGKLIVNVGSVDHPMLDNHYIEFIVVEYTDGFRIKYLNPGDVPHAEFEAEGAVAVYEYCNLHGLWKTEL